MSPRLWTLLAGLVVAAVVPVPAALAAHDALLHALAGGIVAAALADASGGPPARAAGAAVVVALAAAAGFELLQVGLAHRTATAADVWATLPGAAAGATLAVVRRRLAG